MRFGLFEQLLWRVLTVLGIAMLLMLTLTYVHQQRFLYEAWRNDLEQEARWLSLHWSNYFPPQELAAAWSRTHDAVRLEIEDAQGRVIADSRPAEPIDDQLAGRWPMQLRGQTGTVILSRNAPSVFPASVRGELIAALLLIIALATAALYPTVRRLTRTFEQLSGLARRVADGHFGATLPGQARSELADLTSSFNEMSLRLRDTELRNQRLTADVSHELRSPLARLRALSDTIARHPQEATALLVQVDAEIALLDRLVDDLLAMARLEKGMHALALEEVAVPGWCADAFLRLRKRIEAAEVSCAVSIGEAPAARIDPQRMMQALGNLVENAVSATAGKAGARIRLELASSPGGWGFTIEDNGSGIPAADLPHVFERFYRVHSHRSRATGGVGLGLSIARSIVEAHGGRIWIESDPQVGSRVQVRFPHTFPTFGPSAPQTSALA